MISFKISDTGGVGGGGGAREMMREMFSEANNVMIVQGVKLQSTPKLLDAQTAEWSVHGYICPRQ